MEIGYLSEPPQLAVSKKLMDYFNEYSEYVTERGAWNSRSTTERLCKMVLVLLRYLYLEMLILKFAKAIFDI